jgi:hypothetical protein
VPYKVLTGLSYPPDKRAEVGDIVDDLPSTSVKWLLAKGHIEEVGGQPSARKPAPKAPEPRVEDGDE